MIDVLCLHKNLISLRKKYFVTHSIIAALINKLINAAVYASRAYEYVPINVF